MSFEHGLIQGQYYTTYEIQHTFKHNRYRGYKLCTVIIQQN